jgi:hypothetical protein
VSELEDLARDYRTAFLRYLPHRSEAAMAAGYELGRRVASSRASLLDLVLVHHRILSEVLSQQPPPDPEEVTTAAGAFLTEVLATFDMAHRVLHDQPSEDIPT